MSKELKPTKIYFDTNSLKGLKFDTEVGTLLGACKDGVISIFVSEPVIYERARQQYKADKARHVMPSDYSLLEYIAFFKKIFVSHNAVVLEATHEHVDLVDELIGDEEKYFEVSNKNDLRDALIFIMARTEIDKTETVILCEENRLGAEFVKDGFYVRKDTREVLKEILSGSGIESFSKPEISRVRSSSEEGLLKPPLFNFLRKADEDFYAVLQEEFRTLPSTEDKLTEKLEQMNSTDNELNTRILGYTQWFSPASKIELNDLLSKKFDKGLIENNSKRLCQEGLLLDTGTYLLPSDDGASKEICDQAMASVMHEILELIENE